MSEQQRKRVAYGEGRDALLRATVRVVARGGLRALTYRAVAEEAGVTHALVRHHFGARDALLAAATEYSLSPLLEASHLSEARDSRALLFDGIADSLEVEPDIVAFQYEVIVESYRSPRLRESVDRLVARMRATILEELRTHGYAPSTDQAALVAAALDGIVLHGLAAGDTKEARRSLDALREVVARAGMEPG